MFNLAPNCPRQIYSPRNSVVTFYSIIGDRSNCFCSPKQLQWICIGQTMIVGLMWSIWCLTQHQIALGTYTASKIEWIPCIVWYSTTSIVCTSSNNIWLTRTDGTLMVVLMQSTWSPLADIQLQKTWWIPSIASQATAPIVCGSSLLILYSVMWNSGYWHPRQCWVHHTWLV
jgi:hypothetical protein